MRTDPFAIIHEAKNRLLFEENINARWIKLSPAAHEALLDEIKRRDGRRPQRIFEILGLAVEIESECPAGTGYLGAMEREDL